MFTRLAPGRDRPCFDITLDGQTVTLQAGDSLTTAFLLSDRPQTRTTPLSGAARAPYCAMGVCFDCLITLDGRPNQQACLIEAQPGMVVTRQVGKPALTPAGGGGSDQGETA
tara:strand:+ start:4211 stop:4546 length:336 start_codon:yes stop_codon:yes gene_type:complete